MKYIKQSTKLVNSHLIFILFLALCGSVMSLRSLSQEIELLFILLNLIIIYLFLYPIVCGRLVEAILMSPKTLWKHILKVNWLNYFIYYIMLGLLLFATSIILSNLKYQLGINIITYMMIFVWILIKTLVIYTLPLIFLTRRLLYSIMTGVTTLSHHFRKSVPLILLVILAQLAVVLDGLTYRTSNFVTMIGIGFIRHFIIGYLNLLIFTAATITLTKHEKEIIQQ